jgi:hypothetical protein
MTDPVTEAVMGAYCRVLRRKTGRNWVPSSKRPDETELRELAGDWTPLALSDDWKARTDGES